MRKLLLILIILAPFSGLAQTEEHVLQLDKNTSSGPVALTIKPNKKIRLRTYQGDNLTFRRYSFSGDSLIVSGSDTVALKDIKVFKGKVKDNTLRKAGGVMLASAGGYFTTVGALYTIIGAMTGLNPLISLLTIPAFGATLTGAELAGARRFNTSEKWEISVVSQPE